MCNKQNNINRTTYFDYLRVFATFAVIILHVSGQNWQLSELNSFEWHVFNIFDSLVRWSVPVFVMISGSLFLNRDIPLKVIYKKYIFRLVVSYIVWSFIYALFVKGDFYLKLTSFFSGHYHLWFIFMIIGIYMCIPFIKSIVENENKIKYYMSLAFLFSFVIPEVITLFNDFGSSFISSGANVVKVNLETLNLNFVLGYASYFIFGYYINKITLDKKQRLVIYLLGLFGVISTIILEILVTIKSQSYCLNYYGNFTLNVFFQALAVFILFKYSKFNNKKLNDFVSKLSKYSFGVYLVHTLILEQLNIIFGLNTLSFNPIFSTLFLTLIVLLISYLISYLIHKIPVVNKYIV